MKQYKKKCLTLKQSLFPSGVAKMWGDSLVKVEEALQSSKNGMSWEMVKRRIRAVLENQVQWQVMVVNESGNGR